jgi:hypothetical protein
MFAITWSVGAPGAARGGLAELAGISPTSCRIQAYAVHGRLGAVAELLGHEASAAADGELSHGSPLCLRHRIAGRGI